MNIKLRRTIVVILACFSYFGLIAFTFWGLGCLMMTMVRPTASEKADAKLFGICLASLIITTLTGYALSFVWEEEIRKFKYWVWNGNKRSIAQQDEKDG